MQVLMIGVEVKLQRNALSFLEAPTPLGGAAGVSPTTSPSATDQRIRIVQPNDLVFNMC
jgi:hypothetical protein